MNVTIIDIDEYDYIQGRSSRSCYSDEPQKDQVDYFGVDADTADLIRQVLKLSEESEIKIRRQREFDCCGDVREVLVEVQSSSRPLKRLNVSGWFDEPERIASAVDDWLQYALRQAEANRL